MTRKILVLVGLVLISIAQSAPAQDAIADQFYGSGVHRYFAGDLRTALSDFSTAIQAGTQDPRPYYYRALTWMRMGRGTDATADLQRGADLEAADINSTYQVSKALERVQGGLRLQLERYRTQARALAQQRQEQQRRQRYQAAQRFDTERVQRAGRFEEEPQGQATAPRSRADRFDRQAPPAPLPAAQASPFADQPSSEPRPPATRAKPFAPPPTTTAPAPAEANPFGAPPAAERPPAAEANPFGAPPSVRGAEPFGAPAAQEMRTDDAATPFGRAAGERSAEPAAGSFGAPAAEAQPPTERPVTDTGNPFGAPTTRGAPGQPVDPSTRLIRGGSPAAAAPDAANPFGVSPPSEEKPAAPPAPASSPPSAPSDTDSNPFGAPASPAPQSENAAPPAADSPFGTPLPSNVRSNTPENPAARTAPTGPPPVNGGQASSSAPTATGGFLRALRRATGMDAAMGAAEGAAKAIPGVGSGSMPPAPNMAPARGATFTAPPAAADGRRQAAPGQDSDPFKDAGAAPGQADTDNPFGPPDAAGGKAPQHDNPFGAPAGNMPRGTAPPDGNPFKDDPAQPAPSAPSPFGGAR